MHPVRKLLSEITAHRVGTGPIKELTDSNLVFEWHYWTNKMAIAKSWGGAIAAAAEFRHECERELTHRNIPIPITENPSNVR